MSKSRIFLRALLFFIAGVLFGSFVPLGIVYVWMGALAGIVCVSSGLSGRNKKRIIYGLWAVMFFTGVLRFAWTDGIGMKNEYLPDRRIVMRGVVWEEPELREQNAQLKIRVQSVSGSRGIKPFFILATVRKYPEYKLGDELKIEGKPKKPEDSDEFNYAQYLAARDIYQVVYFPLVEKTGEGKISRLRLELFRIKNSFEKKIDQALPEPQSAFLKGLLLGEKTSLPAALIEDFKKTGTTHIIALSGYNITMVGRIFLRLLSALTLPFFVSFWAASAAIILFVLMTGASASLVRAAIMGILVLISRREGRLYNMTNALVFAGALMIFQNPKILRFDAAFQLSFLSTMGLMFFSPGLEKSFDKAVFKLRKKFRPEDEILDPRREKKFVSEKGFDLKKTLIETLAAQLAVLPLLVFLFGRVSLISPLANILVLAAVPYSMALGFLMGLAGFLSAHLNQFLGWPVWVLLEYKIKAIEILSGIPYASIQAGKTAAVFLIIIYIFVLARIWKNNRPRSKAAKYSAGNNRQKPIADENDDK